MITFLRLYLSPSWGSAERGLGKSLLLPILQKAKLRLWKQMVETGLEPTLRDCWFEGLHHGHSAQKYRLLPGELLPDLLLPFLLPLSLLPFILLPSLSSSNLFQVVLFVFLSFFPWKEQ